MSALTVGLWLACCVDGAATYCRSKTASSDGGREGAFGLPALALPLTGTFLTRS